MFNSNLLDILIACVVVFLLLSLLVQAIQTVCKKFFRLKSKQIEDSLVDLFENVFGQRQITVPSVLPGVIQRVLAFFRLPGGTSEAPSADVQTLYSAVKDGFRDVGRTSARGTLMFDTLAKDDFLKVLDKVGAGKILGQTAAPGAPAPSGAVTGAIRQALDGIDGLRDVVTDTEKGVASGPGSQGEVRRNQSRATTAAQLTWTL